MAVAMRLTDALVITNQIMDAMPVPTTCNTGKNYILVTLDVIKMDDETRQAILEILESRSGIPTEEMTVTHLPNDANTFLMIIKLPIKLLS